MGTLTKRTKQLKKKYLINSYKAGACHIGSGLSCFDILVDLLYKRLKKDDVFIFGKASGVGAYYQILADKGLFPESKVSFYLKNYPLPSTEVPGIIHSFGSVGHALPVACGLALGQPDKNFYVLVSDGDLQEGASYEAALFARQHKLKNLFVIVDDNGVIALGQTKDILDLETAYGFFQKTFPNFERVKTTKGQGVDFMEGTHDWHYNNLSEELLKEALCQI